MEKIVLQPGVWTGFYGWAFQPTQRTAIRFRLEPNYLPGPKGIGRPAVPWPEEEAYFVTSGYGPRIVRLADYLPSKDLDIGNLPCFLMPSGDKPASVVITGFAMPGDYFVKASSPDEKAAQSLLNDRNLEQTIITQGNAEIAQLNYQLAATIALIPDQTWSINTLKAKITFYTAQNDLAAKATHNAADLDYLAYQVKTQLLRSDVDNASIVADLNAQIAVKTTIFASIVTTRDQAANTYFAAMAALGAAPAGTL